MFGQIRVICATEMEQRTPRLYPSALLGNKDIEQRLEKKLNDVNSFDNSNNNIKEMITYFKDKNCKSKKKHKIFIKRQLHY